MVRKKLISLNICEGLLLAKQIDFLSQSNADFICLQECTPEIAQKFASCIGYNYSFIETWNKEKNSVGIATLSKLKSENCAEIRYFNDVTNEGISRRVMLLTTYTVSGTKISLINLHFIWAPNSQVTLEQKIAMENVIQLTRYQENLILTGDLNSPRGGAVFKMISKELTDKIPPKYKTSIDGNLHRNGKFDAMVDVLFIQRRSIVDVEQVTFIEGLSDHKALIADIRIGD